MTRALAACFLSLASVSRAQFVIEETTIVEVHAAMSADELTCRDLVQGYLARIEAYDEKGPSLNTVILVNPRALEIADELDRKLASSGFVGSLHCVPVLLKDHGAGRLLRTDRYGADRRARRRRVSRETLERRAAHRDGGGLRAGNEGSPVAAHHPSSSLSRRVIVILFKQ